ncbi:hypothetical protein HNP82_001172 [Catenibacillus scindens]|uniref:Transcobalamin-like C-terminal domain-containing protein n=1 Tax=Catenibacillus scindens TaxID=673271 RepID=A0A7W8M4Z4_9FIRM|nr:DUF4430 domain-containing protein [Catenibacillus scindens]MBB5264067.1 hypothetical protein [Catenibacillus scindens]
MKMNEKSSKKSVIIGLIALIVIVAVIGVIYCIFRPGTQSGSKDITINVINSAGETSSYEVATDAEYLQGAMDDADGLSYETDSTDMVITVNGETADYNTDQAYWAFYINGEYCNYGITQQPVADGDVFSIEYTKG